MLAVTLCAMGCGTKSKDDINIPAAEGSQNTAVDSEDNSAETEEDMGDYSLEDIAKLNGLFLVRKKKHDEITEVWSK